MQAVRVSLRGQIRQFVDQGHSSRGGLGFEIFENFFHERTQLHPLEMHLEAARFEFGNG